MFEHKHDPMLTRAAFIRRMLLHGLIACVIVAVALTIGVLGYRGLGGLAWVDAILDASMILGGMGPVSTLHTAGAKLFASGYALFSGLIFIAVAGLLFAPIFHRVIHHFHMDEGGEGDRES
ncbi:MAG TPA: hypothetical protein VMU02_02995 [bacterium]|nr:hypothetical protein [bacterium]